MARSFALAALLYALPIAAKTDIEGCTSFTSTVTVRPEPGYGNTYNTVIWYVSDTLEICKGVDCGGGRAPPRSVPGCPIYKGTETVTPEFLDHDPMSPKTADASKDKSSQITAAPTLTSTEAEAEETKTSEVEESETSETLVTETSSAASEEVETSTKIETEAKETSVEAPEPTTVVTKPAHKSNETVSLTKGPGETSAKEEATPQPTAVDSPSAGSGITAKGLTLVVGLVGVLAWVL
ncbi:hypothetical protein FSARC_11728 [Fusarium sarcochroum]|uniref:Siderophore biosynthesis enzyme n=1 Tax=Fusarium sarcochroum TaxID=1208366 RepID=A0A8H4TDK8_9HYPO|nr:hypothetical protein FSARC_11728 [Fusarium sarcochroum]